MPLVRAPHSARLVLPQPKGPSLAPQRLVNLLSSQHQNAGLYLLFNPFHSAESLQLRELTVCRDCTSRFAHFRDVG